MTATKILWGQILAVSTMLLAGLWVLSRPRPDVGGLA